MKGELSTQLRGVVKVYKKRCERKLEGEKRKVSEGKDGEI